MHFLCFETNKKHNEKFMSFPFANFTMIRRRLLVVDINFVNLKTFLKLVEGFLGELLFASKVFLFTTHQDFHLLESLRKGSLTELLR